MATVPDYVQTLADIKAALVTICQVITPNANAEPYDLYSQGEFPFWTMLFTRTSTDKEGTGLYRLNETVNLTCHVGGVTEFTDAEAEAQRVKNQAVIEFLQRPFLQSSGTYADGVAGIDSEGISLPEARLQSVEKVIMVVVTLTIPIVLQMDTIDY